MARPFICVVCSPAATVSAEAGRREPPEGRRMSDAPPPSAPSSKPRNPPSGTGSTTAAPAPSANRIAVSLSSQSTKRESTSAPMTSTQRAQPDETAAQACARA